MNEYVYREGGILLLKRDEIKHILNCTKLKIAIIQFTAEKIQNKL